MMKDNILHTIKEYNMFTRGDRLLAAFSGGADSVALLHFLSSLREDWGISVGALHLNHNLRGEESRRDEAFVRDFCGDTGVPLVVESADIRAIAERDGEGIESCGRRLRYDFFAREAKRQGAKVALAHTRSDSAETMLLNLARGTGPRGLCGIPPVRGQLIIDSGQWTVDSEKPTVIIRPLIDCAREDVERYCTENSLDFVTDSTNHSDGYARNRIRRHVIPLLLAENPRLLEHMAAAAKLLRADSEYIDGEALAVTEKLLLPDGGVGRGGFLALSPALRGRVLLELMRRHSLEAGRPHVERLESIIQSGSGRWQLSRDVIFRCRGQSFRFEKTQGRQQFFSLRFLPKQTAGEDIFEAYPGKRVKITVAENKNFEKIRYFEKKGLTYCLDCDKIEDVVTLRQKLPEDKLRLPGRGCSKTLKNLFQELDVPPEERLRRVVAADAGGILWVEGIGVDERAAVTGQTKRVMAVEVQ